jgi:hypothetical protein
MKRDVWSVVIGGTRMSIQECTNKTQFIRIQSFAYRPKLDVFINESKAREFKVR